MPGKRKGKGGEEEAQDSSDRNHSTSQNSVSQLTWKEIEQMKEEEAAKRAAERDARTAKRNIDLATPLCELSQRRKEVDEEEKSKVNPRNHTIESQECDIPRSETLVLSGDGGCQQGRSNRCACSVFDTTYDSPYSKAWLLDDGIDTPLKAETASLIFQIRTAIAIHAQCPCIRVLKAKIDAAPLFNVIHSGDILRYVVGRSKDSTSQESLYHDLREAIDRLKVLGITLELVWVPRILNQEADELCNAILNQRRINTSIASCQDAPEVETKILFELLHNLQRKRRSTIRSLPNELSKHWQAFIFHLLSRYHQDPLRTRILFMIAPHLITFGRKPWVGGRDDFSHIKVHLMMLQKPEYLDDIVINLWKELSKVKEEKKEPSSSKRSTLSPTQIQSFCSRGLFSKLWQEGDIVIAEDSPLNKEIIDKGIPVAELPVPIPEGPKHEVNVVFHDVRTAVKKLRNGKSTGLSGWCRELLYPICCLNTPPSTRKEITQLFSDIVNVRLQEGEEEFLRSLILIPFTYPDKPGKIRSILITDGILKVAWKIGMEGILDPRMVDSGLVWGKEGQSGIAVCASQQALSMGRVIICYDSSNAFPTISRLMILAAAGSERCYLKCIKLINMMYTKRCTARWYVFNGEVDFHEFYFTDGTMQGCVSGPMCYALGTVELNRRFPHRLVQVADDINDIGETALDDAEKIVAAFKEIGQKIDGPKMKVILPAGKTKEDYPQLARPVFQNATIVTGPVEIVGGIITQTEGCSYQDLRLAAAPKVIQRLQSRTNCVLKLDTTIQNKVLALRRLVWTVVYFAQTVFNPHSKQLFEEVDDIIFKALKVLFPFIEPAAHTSTLSKPIEDGGLGFMRMSDVCYDLQAKLMIAAEPYLKYFNLAPMNAPPVVDKPIRYIWRMQSGTSKNAFNRDGYTFTKVDFNSFWDCRPATKLTRIPDDVYTHAVKIHLDALQPFPGKCLKDATRCANPDFMTWSNETFTRHSTTCQECVQAMIYARHEAVVDAIRKTNKFYGVPTHIPRITEFPLPDNSRGGPDIMIFGKEKGDAVDVTITTVDKVRPGEKFSSSLKAVFDAKMRKYEDFQVATQYRIVPFVMSHVGIIARETRALTKQWSESAADHQFLFDLYNHVQIALIKSQYDMFNYFKNCNDRRVLESIEGTVVTGK